MSRTFLPREIREGLNKASGYLQADHLDKALDCMIAALKELGKHPLSVLKEARPAIQSFLHAFAKHPRVSILLEHKEDVFDAITYRLGIEAKLAVVLEGMAKILQEQTKLHASITQLAEQRQRQHFLIQSGLKHLEDGQILLAEAFFQRLLAEFPEAKEELLACARHLEESGCLAEAGNFYASLLERHPDLAEASSRAIDIWMRLKDYERADAAIKQALHVFGAHPRTLLRRAHLYVLMGKPEEAKGMLEEALDKDPSLSEAHALWEELHKP